MSAERRDFGNFERLTVNDLREDNAVITVAVQSAQFPDNWPTVTTISVSSLTIVQTLPAEATNEGKVMEFFVVSTTTSGTLTLKDASGNTVVSAAAINGYAKAVCVRGVWR